MSKYELVIYWSNEDNAFIVEVPELPGCMADGATYQEAVANAERVIGEWVETATDLGAPYQSHAGGCSMHEALFQKRWMVRNHWRRGGYLAADLHQALNHGIQLTVDLIQPPQCGDGTLFDLLPQSKPVGQQQTVSGLHGCLSRDSINGPKRQSTS